MRGSSGVVSIGPDGENGLLVVILTTAALELSWLARARAEKATRKMERILVVYANRCPRIWSSQLKSGWLRV